MPPFCCLSVNCSGEHKRQLGSEGRGRVLSFRSDIWLWLAKEQKLIKKHITNNPNRNSRMLPATPTRTGLNRFVNSGLMH